MKDQSRIHYQSFNHIFLYITEKCQLRCKHCYMGDRLNRQMEMDINQIRKYLSYFFRIGAKHLTLLGGEPTIHNNFEEIIFLAHSIGYKEINIDTNGLYISKILKINNSLFNYIRVSLDGPNSDSHDFIRGKGCFKKTTKNIKILVQSGFRVAITCTISKHNIRFVSEFLDLAQEFGITLLNFHVLSEEGYGRKLLDQSLETEEWIDFCQYLEQVKHKYNFSIWYPPTWTTKSKLERYVKEGFRGCLGITIDRLSVFPDGKCYICSVLFDTSLNFGIIDENGFKLNKNENEFELFMDSLSNSESNFLSWCPAEKVIERRKSIESEQEIISVCRCWKSQI